MLISKKANKKIGTILIIIFFGLLTFSFYWFLWPRSSFAASCIMQASDTTDRLPSFGVLNQDTSIYATFPKSLLENGTILSSYIYDGYGWKKGGAYTETNDVIVAMGRKYSETKDFVVAASITYQTASGVKKEISCQNYLSIFKRVIVDTDYGYIFLNYPDKITNRLIFQKDSKKRVGNYIGYVFMNNYALFIGANFFYDNFNFLPYPPSLPNGWCYTYTINNNTGNKECAGATVTTTGWGKIRSSVVYYPYLLPTQIIYNFSAPTFKTGEGTGARASYGFYSVIVYSRDNQRNSVSNPPRAPTTIESAPINLVTPKITTGLPPRATY